MGYIFDALNKTPAAKQAEQAKPESQDSMSGLVEAAMSADAASKPFLPSRDELDQSAVAESLGRVERAAKALVGDQQAGSEELATKDPMKLTEATASAPSHEGLEPLQGDFDIPPAPLPMRDPSSPPPVDLKSIDDRLVVLADPASTVAEEYRSIRTSLLARCENGCNLVHLITSATPQEGKTITTVNLGLAFSELVQRRTLIVEADLRLPNFDKLLDLQKGPGLLQFLRGEVHLEDAIQAVSPNGLHVLPAGGRTTNEAVQLLSSQRCKGLVHKLRASYDHVLIDTPPVNELADAGILGTMSDEVMLVARMRRTPRELVEQAIRTLQSYHVPLVGTIATDTRKRGLGYGRYGYKYGYRYQYTRAAKKAA